MKLGTFDATEVLRDKVEQLILLFLHLNLSQDKLLLIFSLKEMSLGLFPKGVLPPCTPASRVSFSPSKQIRNLYQDGLLLILSLKEMSLGLFLKGALPPCTPASRYFFFAEQL